MSLVLDDNKLQEIYNDGEYLHRDYNELLEKYDQNYVAIKNQKVFKYAKTLEELKDLLQKENIQLGTIFIKFIRDKRNFM
jgi:hypothetical protein